MTHVQLIGPTHNYIKGNIDLRELIDAYAIITQEERIAEHRKGIGVLDEYMMIEPLIL